MILDAVFSALAAVLSIAMALLGGLLASQKLRYRILFWSLAGAAAVIAIVMAIRSERPQAALQNQLNTIQKNTEQSPKVEVNVPTAPKQRAVMALSRTNADDGIEIGHDQQHPQAGWLVNVFCRNIGTTVVAKKVLCAAYTERIPAKGGVPDRETLLQYWQTFSNALASAHPRPSVDLEPGENIWHTLGLHMVDVDPELNSGDKVVFVAGAILYSDDAGAHKKEFCRWAQPPFDPLNAIWHYCETGHNSEVY